jgi:hypothetical protein
VKEFKFYARTVYLRKDHSGLTVVAIHTQDSELVEIYLGEAQAKLVEPEIVEPCA